MRVILKVVVYKKFLLICTGKVFKFTVDPQGQLPSITQQSTPMAPLFSLVVYDLQSLCLGIAYHPSSDATKVHLLFSLSSISQSSGKANSGRVAILLGPSYKNLEDIVTGLPRAIANHAPNSLHFGPDGALFISIGGNTGAGSANVAGTEFLTRVSLKNSDFADLLARAMS